MQFAAKTHAKREAQARDTTYCLLRFALGHQRHTNPDYSSAAGRTAKLSRNALASGLCDDCGNRGLAPCG